MMTDDELYLFDLNGYIVVEGVLSIDEVARCNEAIDHRQNDSPTGGTSPCTARPTMMLNARNTNANVSNACGRQELIVLKCDGLPPDFGCILWTVRHKKPSCAEPPIHTLRVQENRCAPQPCAS